MADRPPIPEGLRRRVLVEAGHRCAIHTCRYPGVDVHHIIPWERCQKHDYDNLIALCPNCHRRAGFGEIDRKSLQMYKARLSSGVIATELPAVGGTEVEDDGPRETEWKTVVIAEKTTEPPRYEVEIEFPEFVAADLAELNIKEHVWALSQIYPYRRFLLSAASAFGEEYWERGWSDSLSGSFKVLFFTPQIVSIRYSLFSYGVGAAHPNHPIRTVTVQRTPLIPLSLEDLFLPESRYLEHLSQYAIASLSKQLADDPHQVTGGAGPESENFAHFNVTDAGLLLTFPEYQVACYAAGPQYVTVPWSEIRESLNPRCAVMQTAEGG